MQWYIGVFIALFIQVACQPTPDKQANPTDTGLVKDTVVITETIRYNMQQQPFMRSLFKYNDDGQLIKEVMWDSSGMGVRIQHRTIEYLEGKPSIVRLKDPEGNQLYQINYSYNEAGKLIQEAYIDDAGSTTKRQVYDDRGNAIAVITTDQSGREQRSVYTYNSANKMDTAISYLPDGRRQQMNIYRYKNDTLMTDCLFIDESDSIYLHWTYSYNAAGQLESEYEMGANGTQFVIKRYFFNDDGQKIREESYKGRMYTLQYIYSKAGDLQEQRMVDNSGVIRSKTLYAPLTDQRN